MARIPAKILLVDDIQKNLAALENLLRAEDLEIFSALTPVQALALVAEHEFALAIIDIQMAGGGGLEVAEMMRSGERSRQTPLIFVTSADVEAGNAFVGYQSGAIDFLHQPLDPHTVRSKVSVFVELYQYRAALNEQVDELEKSRHEQQALLDQLQQTQAELEQAMKLRDQFMSVVSHELRTPLNTMKLELYARRMSLEAGDLAAFTPDRLHEMVEADERQLNRLVRLINDMTDVSRIRTGQLSIRTAEVELAALVRRVLQQFALQIEAAGAQLQVLIGGDTRAQVDEFRIEQAFINLLTNALRHCGRGRLDIVVEGLGDQVRLAVRDYGPGIAAADRERIFKLFERGPRERKGSGLGLGLYIASQIVGAHGGHVQLDSEPGAGACFALLLPRVADTAFQ